MATVLRIGNLRVAIYTNDHQPAHVHVIGNGGEAIFILHCPDGPPRLRDRYGFTERETGRMEAALASVLDQLCREWSKIHGDY